MAVAGLLVAGLLVAGLLVGLLVVAGWLGGWLGSRRDAFKCARRRRASFAFPRTGGVVRGAWHGLPIITLGSCEKVRGRSGATAS